MTTNEILFLKGYSQFLDDSGEHFTYAALSTYRNFAGELSEKEKHYFSAHLTSCQKCSARLLEIEDIEGPVVENYQKSILKISPQIFRYAMAAILIIALGITVILINQNVQQDTIAVEDVHSRQFAVVTSDSSKFIPNQVLENFIERTVRSTSTVTLLAPDIGDTLTIPFIFKWKGNNEENTFVLLIVDNNNMEVWKQETVSSEVTLSQQFTPGLYYLKLGLNQKLMQVGKFVVIR